MMATRPPPPSTPPPMQPRVGINEANDGALKTTSLLASPAYVPKYQTLATPTESLRDDLSTTPGSSDGEQEDSSSLSRSPSPAPSECEFNYAVVGRDVMLFHWSLSLRVPAAPGLARGLHCRPVAASPPPGLSATPKPAIACVAPPPGLELPNHAAPAPLPYSPPVFRKELRAIFKDLTTDRNVAKAVRRVRAQGVPRERQAAEFADAVTYVLEEPRGPARRSFIAFVAGIFAAFEKTECVSGLDLFFRTVYPDLQEEVPKLAKIVNIELLPTLSSVLSAKELSSMTELATLGAGSSG